MISKMRVFLAISICVVLSLCITACSPSEKQGEAEIPKEVQTLVDDYMTAYKIGNKELVEYAHFEEDFIREAFIAADDKLIDYKIESTEKINDNLYQFTISIKTTQTQYHSDDFVRVYNFVAFINDRWYFINGVTNIPDTHKENLDESKYVYEDENIVDREDVLGEIK